MAKDSWFRRTFGRYAPRDYQAQLAGKEWEGDELENQLGALQQRAIALGLRDMAAEIGETLHIMGNLRERAGHRFTRRGEKRREWKNRVGHKIVKEDGAFATDDEGDVLYTGKFGDLFIKHKKTVRMLEGRQDRNNVEAMTGRYLAQGLRIRTGDSPPPPPPAWSSPYRPAPTR